MITATTNFINALANFSSGKILQMVTISGYTRVFTNYDSGISGQYDWIVSIDDCTTTINDLDGGADQIVMAIYVQDNGGSITSDFPEFTFEGKQITLSIGLPGLAQADFMTVFTGYIDTVGSNNGNQEYVFNCSDVSSKLQQVIYTTGDSGQPTDSNNPKTLLGHPIDILLDILNNKIGLAPALVDSTKLTAYRDGPLSGMQMNFHLTQSVTAMDFIKNQIMKPMGGYIWVNSLGQITANFFVPLSTPTPVFTLSPDYWIDIPGVEQVDLINIVQFQFDKDDANGNSSGNYLAQDTEEYGPSISKYGQFGEQVIQSDGLRSGFQGFFTARLVSKMIFGRYGLRNTKLDQYAPDAFWATCRIEPGDVIAVTHPDIPDRVAGRVGITGKLFEVLDRSFKFNEGLMNLTMIDASYLSVLGTFKIAPNGTANYTAGSNTFMYMCSDLDKYSNGDAAHVLG